MGIWGVTTGWPASHPQTPFLFFIFNKKIIKKKFSLFF
jgi:hypothetical protein